MNKLIIIIITGVFIFLLTEFMQNEFDKYQAKVDQELKCAWSAGKARIPLKMINKGTYCEFFANDKPSIYGMAY